LLYQILERSRETAQGNKETTKEDNPNTTHLRPKDLTTNQETKEQHPVTNKTSLRGTSKEDRAKRKRENITHKKAKDNTSYQEAKEERRL
jgi:hypothetical protein